MKKIAAKAAPAPNAAANATGHAPIPTGDHSPASVPPALSRPTQVSALPTLEAITAVPPPSATTHPALPKRTGATQSHRPSKAQAATPPALEPKLRFAQLLRTPPPFDASIALPAAVGSRAARYDESRAYAAREGLDFDKTMQEVTGQLVREAGLAAAKRRYDLGALVFMTEFASQLHPDHSARASFINAANGFKRAKAEEDDHLRRASDIRRARDQAAAKLSRARPENVLDALLMQHEAQSASVELVSEIVPRIRGRRGEELRESFDDADVLLVGISDKTLAAITSIANSMASPLPITQFRSSCDELRAALGRPEAAALLGSKNTTLVAMHELLRVADEVSDFLHAHETFEQVMVYALHNHAMLRELIELLTLAPRTIASEIVRVELEAEEPGHRAGPHSTRTQKGSEPKAKRHRHQPTTSAPAAASAAKDTIGAKKPTDAPTSPAAAAAAVPAPHDEGSEVPFTLVAARATVVDPETGRLRSFATEAPGGRIPDHYFDDHWAPGTMASSAWSAAYHFRKHGHAIVRPNPSDPPTIEQYTRMAWKLIHDPAARARAEPRHYLRATLDGAARVQAAEYRAFYTHNEQNFAIFIQHVRDPENVRIVSAGRYVPRE